MITKDTNIIDNVICGENKFIRALIQSAQLGNNAALEQLYAMTLGKIYAFAFLLTGDKQLAEDITIETLVYAWNKVSEINEETNFTDWLKKIAIHFTLKKIKEGNFSENAGKEEVENDYTSSFLKVYSALEYKNKFIITLNFMENYAATDIAAMLQVEEEEVAKRIINSIIEIGNKLSSKKSVDEILEMLTDLPTEILPEINLLKKALDKIYEKKLDEFEIKEREEEEKLKEELLRNKKEYEAKKKEKPKPVKKKKRKKHISGRKLAYYVAASFVFIMGFIYINSRPQSWTISVSSGSADLNNEPIVKSVEFAENDILRTNTSSSGEVNIPGAGKIILFPSTVLKRIAVNQLKLTKGKIEVVSNSAEEFPAIELNKITITDYQTGTNYKIEMNKKRYDLIDMKKGWLKVDDGKIYTVLSGGYSLKISARQVVGLPYNQKSDKNLIALIENISFKNKSSSQIFKLLDAASYEEALTLWNLLKRVGDNQRVSIYDKLYQLVPPPDQITKKKMLSLDDESMNKWLDEIRYQL